MDTCSEIAACMSYYAPIVFDTAFSIVAVASAIAALTPTPTDDTFLARVYKVIDALALNIGYAKDRGKVPGGRFVPK